MKLLQIEYHDKFNLLTAIQASIDFYDVIKTIQNNDVKKTTQNSAGTPNKSQGIFQK